jgi:hypothetical protein
MQTPPVLVVVSPTSSPAVLSLVEDKSRPCTRRAKALFFLAERVHARKHALHKRAYLCTRTHTHARRRLRITMPPTGSSSCRALHSSARACPYPHVQPHTRLPGEVKAEPSAPFHA